MKKIIIISIIILLFLLPMAIISSCAAPTPSPTSATAPEPPIPTHFVTYTEENLFSLSYPPDWETAMSIISGLEESIQELLKDVKFAVPPKEYTMIFFAGRLYEERYTPSVNIIVGPAIGSTLDEEFEAQMRGLKPTVENYKLFEQIKTVVGGREAMICDHEYNIRDMPRMRGVHLLILENDFSWVVTCGALPEHFPDNQEIINQVVRSFRILK